MSRQLVAPEEVRDELRISTNSLLNGHGDARTVAWIARQLVCSDTTVRRHLRTLIERGWVTERAPVIGSRRRLYTLTAAGIRASDRNEGL